MKVATVHYVHKLKETLPYISKEAINNKRNDIVISPPLFLHMDEQAVKVGNYYLSAK